MTSYYVVFESKELHVYTATRTDLKNCVEGKISTGMRSTVRHHLFILKHINRKSYINKQKPHTAYLPRIHTYPRKNVICIRECTYGNGRANGNELEGDDGVI